MMVISAEWTIYRFMFPHHYNEISKRVGLWKIRFNSLVHMSKPENFYFRNYRPTYKEEL